MPKCSSADLNRNAPMKHVQLLCQYKTVASLGGCIRKEESTDEDIVEGLKNQQIIYSCSNGVNRKKSLHCVCNIMVNS